MTALSLKLASFFISSSIAHPEGWTGRVQKLSFKTTRKIGVKSLSSNVVYGQLVTIVSDTADVAGLNEKNRLARLVEPGKYYQRTV